MSPVHADMLKKFGSFARDRNYFTTTGHGFMGLAPAIAQRNLDELVALGLITKIKTGYKLTQAGRNHMDGPGQHTPDTPHRRPDWMPPKWEPARGAEARQHEQYKSLGHQPQIERRKDGV